MFLGEKFENPRKTFVHIKVGFKLRYVSSANCEYSGFFLHRTKVEHTFPSVSGLCRTEIHEFQLLRYLWFKVLKTLSVF